MVFFLVTPAKVKDAKTTQSSSLKSYMEDISKLNITITDLEKQVESLNSDNQSLSDQITQLEGQQAPDNTAIYNTLLEAVTLYVNNDKTGCADKLTTITSTDGMSEQFMSLYQTLVAQTYPDAATTHINQGSKLSNNEQWQEALNELLLGEKMSPEDISCLYNIGKCYYELNGKQIEDNSKAYFEKVIALAPNSDYAGWAKSRLK